jgi:hypothetical protein
MDAAARAEGSPRLAQVFAYPGTQRQAPSPRSPRQGAAQNPHEHIPSSELVEFLEVAERRVKAIEQAAEAAISHVSLELDRLLERLTAGADSDAERMRATGDVVVGHARAVAEWSVGVRRWLESEFSSERGRPSDGVILLARRMTIAGIPAAKIEAMLAGLGVTDPQAAVRHALDAPID